MHPAKRRKLDVASSTLSKPFRSPMRVDPNAESRQINHKEQTVPGQCPNPTDHKVNLHANVTKVEPTTVHHSTTEPPRPFNSSSPIQRPPYLLSSSARRPAKDPEYLSLQQQHSALVLQLSKLRQSLDTAQQALKIQSSHTDAELEILVRKWQLASREAAEELFASAKDRVNRMGGVGAWRERSQRQTQGWDEQEAASQNHLTDEQKDLIEEQKEEMEAERRKYGIAKVEEAAEEKDDESFTMDMMLKTLNVGLELLGYDRQSQRWID